MKHRTQFLLHVSSAKSKHFFKSAHADAEPGHDNARYYAIQITASQLLD